MWGDGALGSAFRIPPRRGTIPAPRWIEGELDPNSTPSEGTKLPYKRQPAGSPGGPLDSARSGELPLRVDPPNGGGVRDALDSDHTRGDPHVDVEFVRHLLDGPEGADHDLLQLLVDVQ